MRDHEPIRVLHVTRIPVTVTAFLMPLLRAHRDRGHAVSVACSDGPETPVIEGDGFPVHRYRLERSLTPWNVAKAIGDLTRIVRRQRIDWVFTHTPIASGIARIAARFAGVRGVMYMAHGLPCAPRIRRVEWVLWYLVERALGQLTDGLITMNRYDFDLARRHRFIRRLEHVYRVNGVGVDVDRLDSIRRQTDAAAVKRDLGLPDNRPMMLLLARTVPQKGIREFLTTARDLIRGEVAASFVIAGSGPLDDEIAGFVRDHRLERNLLFLGWRRDAQRLVAACDVFVLPTYYPEGLPVSILEAMACGKPVVATWHRGCEDVIVDGVSGLLVEPGDAAALADAIRRLLKEPDMALRLGAAGRVRVDRGFRIDQTTASIIAAFEQIAATPRGR